MVFEKWIFPRVKHPMRDNTGKGTLIPSRMHQALVTVFLFSSWLWSGWQSGSITSLHVEILSSSYCSFQCDRGESRCFSSEFREASILIFRKMIFKKSVGTLKIHKAWFSLHHIHWSVGFLSLQVEHELIFNSTSWNVWVPCVCCLLL